MHTVNTSDCYSKMIEPYNNPEPCTNQPQASQLTAPDAFTNSDGGPLSTWAEGRLMHMKLRIQRAVFHECQWGPLPSTPTAAPGLHA